MRKATVCNRLQRCRLAAAGLGFVFCCGTALGAWAAPADLGRLEVTELAAAPARWVLLDARPRERWADGHIPGAHPFSWEDYTRPDSAGVPHRVLPPGELAAALGGLDIDPDTALAVYGDADSSWGGEGWVIWVLSWLGHRGPVRLLDGGIQAWRKAGLPLVRDSVAPTTPHAYGVALRPGLVRTVAQMQPTGPGEVPVDTRSTLEWFTGHLPGAVHLPWKDLYTGPERRPISPETYRALLTAAGVRRNQTPVFYCTGGIRSAYAWLVHRLADAGPAANFEGGTEAWERRSKGTGRER